MRHFSVGRSPVGLLISILLVTTVNGQVPAKAIAPSAHAAHRRAAEPVQLSYTGAFLADGKYRAASQTPHGGFRNLLPDGSARPAEVPPSVNLHPREVTVENLLPRYHAARPARGQSFWKAFRDDLVTFAYGHEKLLAAPQRVTTDSNARVIVADPSGASVHVLSEGRSFRILTGESRRVQTPAGVAVDAESNIYIADADRGVVAVYDSAGRFLRYIGDLHGETLFYRPAGLAIDRRTARLYVIDTDRNEMFIMDTVGHEIGRASRSNSQAGRVELQAPTEVAVGDGEVAILDAGGTRVWLAGLDGTPLSQFKIGNYRPNDAAGRAGIAIDSTGNIYVTDRRDGFVCVYGIDGHLLASFGHPGENTGEIRVPAGLWIDSQSRMYVSDENNRRVEVFQLSLPEAEEVAAAH